MPRAAGQPRAGARLRRRRLRSTSRSRFAPAPTTRWVACTRTSTARPRCPACGPPARSPASRCTAPTASAATRCSRPSCSVAAPATHAAEVRERQDAASTRPGRSDSIDARPRRRSTGCSPARARAPTSLRDELADDDVRPTAACSAPGDEMDRGARTRSPTLRETFDERRRGRRTRATIFNTDLTYALEVGCLLEMADVLTRCAHRAQGEPRRALAHSTSPSATTRTGSCHSLATRTLDDPTIKVRHASRDDHQVPARVRTLLDGGTSTRCWSS